MRNINLSFKYWLFIGLIATGCSKTNHQDASESIKKAVLLQKQLKLTDAQTLKVTAIYQESVQKLYSIKQAEQGNTDKMLIALAPLRMVTIKKIKDVLTYNQATQYDLLTIEPENIGYGRFNYKLGRINPNN